MINGIDKALVTQRDQFSLDWPYKSETKRDVSGCAYRTLRVYNGTGGALTQYAMYTLSFDGDEETNPKLIANVSGASTGLYYAYRVVATEAAAAAAYTDVVVWGWYTCLVEGTTDVAKDDFLKIDTSVSTTAPIKDGTTKTTGSVAIAAEAQATNSAVAARVFLLGERAVINA